MHAHAPGATDQRTAGGRQQGRLAWALAFTGTFLVVETVAGLWTGSLALLADAGHMLTDVVGLALALFALRLAARPANERKTYGYYRVEILAAAANAVILLGMSGYILYEAYRRFFAPPEVIAGPMLVVAVIGLGVNLGSMWMLQAGAKDSLNVKGAYFEVLSDALGSLGVIMAAVIVLVTGWQVVDPIIAAGIGLFIIPRTWKLLGEAVNVLLEGAPPHLDVDEIERAVATVPGIRGVHDFHVWTLTSGKYAMSGHIEVADLTGGAALLARLHELLHTRFGIDHTTIQLEPPTLLEIERKHDQRPWDLPTSESESGR